MSYRFKGLAIICSLLLVNTYRTLSMTMVVQHKALAFSPLDLISESFDRWSLLIGMHYFIGIVQWRDHSKRPFSLAFQPQLSKVPVR